MTTLANYISTDPDDLGLSALVNAGNDADIAARINAPGKTKSVEVSCYVAYRYLIGRMLWRPIVAAANDVNHPAHIAACAAVDLVSPGADIGIDFINPLSQPMLTALDAAGLLGTTGRADLEAMCTVPATFGEVAGLGIVDATAVARALRG